MEIYTPRLLLREFRPADFDAFYAIESNPQVRRFEGDIHTPEQVRERLEKLLEQAQAEPRTYFRLAVTVPPDDSLRGYVKLSLNFAAIREWEIGWYLHPAVWGQGYAAEAARPLLEYAFRRLDAHRVIAFCHAGNQQSERVMQKLGMQREGHLRETVWIDNRWHDELVYGILDREFQSLVK